MEKSILLDNWNEALKLTSEAGLKLEVDWFLKNAREITYSEEEERLTVGLGSVGLCMLTKNDIAVLEGAVRHVFGKGVSLELKDGGEDESDESCREQSSVGVSRPDLTQRRRYDDMLKMKSSIKEKPEDFFRGSIASGLLQRVLYCLGNGFEVKGSGDYIRVEREKERLTVYVCNGRPLCLNKLLTEFDIFNAINPFYLFLPEYPRRSRYLPCSIYYGGASEKNDTRFFANFDPFLAFFLLITLCDFVSFENIGDKEGELCRYRKGEADSGKTGRYVAEKPDGSYITWETDEEFTNEEICRVLEEASCVFGGLGFGFLDLDTREERHFLRTYDAFTKTDKKGFGKTITAIGQDRYDERHYYARVSADLCPDKNNDGSRVYYNYSLLENDNPFEKRFYESFVKSLAKKASVVMCVDLGAEDIAKATSLVLNIKTDNDCTFWSPVRENVQPGRMILDIIDDIADEIAEGFLSLDEAWRLIERIQKEREVRRLELLFPDGMK